VKNIMNRIILAKSELIVSKMSESKF